jgi:hypothetical protein
MCHVQYNTWYSYMVVLYKQLLPSGYFSQKVNQSLQCSSNTINEAHLQCMYPLLTFFFTRQCMFIKSKLFLYIHWIKRNNEITQQSEINHSLIAYAGELEVINLLPLYLDYHSWKKLHTKCRSMLQYLWTHSPMVNTQ